MPIDGLGGELEQQFGKTVNGDVEKPSIDTCCATILMVMSCQTTP